MHIDDTVTHFMGEPFQRKAVEILNANGFYKWSDIEMGLADKSIQSLNGIGAKTVAALKMNVSLCRMKESGEI